MQRYFGIAICALAAALACGGGSDEASSPSSDTPAAPGRPSTAANLVIQQDLIELAHLADVDHHGLFIDFGGPARPKYTVGNWNSGWGSDGVDGDITYTHVGDTGRVYFPLRQAGEHTLRFQMKPLGSRRMQLFLNGSTLEGVVLQEGEQFRTYDVRVPAERTRVGDNYLLLRFGGTTNVGGENVAVAMASLRVIEGEAAAEERFAAPSYDTLVSAVELGGAERQALAVRAPTRLSYHFEVPSGGRLIFGLGAEGDASGLTARVQVTPEGGAPASVFDATPSGEWNDQSVSLERFEGQVVRIDFGVEGQGPGRVAWSTPALMVPPPQVAERPRPIRNVVVLLIDTLRADRLHAYNPETRVRAPALQRVAERGIVFEQAQSPENWTKPSCASILTGLYPMTHGAKTSEARLSDSAELLSETLRGSGFRTGSFIANGYVSDRFGFDQGWDHYTNFIREGKNTDAENVFREAAEFIEQNREERFFVYIQTIDPHVPYDPPERYLRMYDDRNYTGQVQPRQTPDLLEAAKRSGGGVRFDASDQRRLEALYDGEVSYHDEHFGAFMERLSELGVADDTLVVITSDHGEEFNDHGSWGHGHSVYQEMIGMPLIFHLPGRLPEGRRVSSTVATLDIPQTVVDLTGVTGMARAEGQSLVPDILGQVVPGPRVGFSDFQDIRRVIRGGRYKLVVRANLTSAFFDLEDDPGERRERNIEDFPIAGRYMRVLLGQFLGARNRGQWLSAEQTEAQALEVEDAEMDDAIRAQLRALGYAN